SGIVRQVLSKARRAVRSESGKALLRKRGEHIERSFCHVLDHGKHRRATLRGRVNLSKRQLAAALTHNLSLMMRHLTGYGTVKQWLAGNRTPGRGLSDLLRTLLSTLRSVWERLSERLVEFLSDDDPKSCRNEVFIPPSPNCRSSTGC
ncbi:transposase, partial [Luteolibacter algae]